MGRVIDFKNVILIMTSNIGARAIQGEREMGFRGAAPTRKTPEPTPQRWTASRAASRTS